MSVVAIFDAFFQAKSIILYGVNRPFLTRHSHSCNWKNSNSDIFNGYP